MSYLKLPQRVFNSPLIESANFKDGSFVNLIRLNTPYKNGTSYAVYETTKSPFCSNGLYKTFEQAKVKFDLMVRNGSKESEIRNLAKFDHSKPYPNNREVVYNVKFKN